jgi:hypothetical protein
MAGTLAPGMAVTAIDIGARDQHGVSNTGRRFETVALVIVVVVTVALLVIAGVQLLWNVAIVIQPREVMYGESVIHDQASRLLRGEPLYQPVGEQPYTVTAYTPLFYWLAGGLQWAIGTGFWPGRLVSLIASAGVASMTGWLATRHTSSRIAGAFAALVFLALGVPGDYSWGALYKEDLLGVALSLACIALLATGERDTLRVVAAGSCAALAVLTKQTMVAAGLAGFAWLVVYAGWRKALLFGAVGATAVLGCLGVLQWSTAAFIDNTVLANVNPFRLDALVSNMATLLRYQAGPLAAAALFVASQARRWKKRAETRASSKTVPLLISYWTASLLPLLGLAKVGASQNYWIELAAITAVLATAGVWRQAPERVPSNRDATGSVFRGIHVMSTLMIGITALSVAPGTALFASSGLAALWPAPENVAAFGRVVERVRSEPRDVLADPLDVVVLAGKATQLEPAIFAILERQGRWDATPFVRRICAGEVGILVLGYPLDDGGPHVHGFQRWPAPVLDALRETMTLEDQTGGRFLYVFQAPTSSTAARTRTCSVS